MITKNLSKLYLLQKKTNLLKKSHEKIFCSFELVKMHCEFTYTTNAFQDES